MRHKLRLFSLILIVIFIISFTACTTPKTVTEATTVVTTKTETTAPETTATVTIPETTAAETTAPEATTKSKIAFYSNRDGNNEIYIMNVDGSEQVNLTNNPAEDMGPSFSP